MIARIFISIGLAGLAVATFAASSAASTTGGLSFGPKPTAAPHASTVVQGQNLQAHLGTRALRPGMRGRDVRALHGILRAIPVGKGIRLVAIYHGHTVRAVTKFQRKNELRPTGVVNRPTLKALARAMKVGKSTWYGPGFYGNKTACGQTLTTATVGVAHRTLPCGTRVTFRYRGKSLVTQVIDRGPFVSGIDWDLTGAAAQRLGFSGSEYLRYLVSE